jgi:hypothetical protein
MNDMNSVSITFANTVFLLGATESQESINQLIYIMASDT